MPYCGICIEKGHRSKLKQYFNVSTNSYSLECESGHVIRTISRQDAIENKRLGRNTPPSMEYYK